MEPTELQRRLESEVMEVELDALAPHVARGGAVWVHPDIPIVKVAMAVSLDLADDVKAWMADGAIRKLGDQDTEQWSPQDRFRFVIVQPFVLLQPLAPVSDADAGLT